MPMSNFSVGALHVLCILRRLHRKICWIVVAEALHHGAMLAQLQGREEGSDGRRLLMLIVRHRHGREHGRSAGTRYAGRAYYGRGQCSPTWGRCSPTWGHGWPACNPTPRLALPACNPNGAPPPPVCGLPYALHHVDVKFARVKSNQGALGKFLVNVIIQNAVVEAPPPSPSHIPSGPPALRPHLTASR